MILYTVMPLELVFEDKARPGDEIIETTYLGRQVLSKAGTGGQRQIVRLLSTDPADFLDSRFFPGQAISS